MKLLYKKGSWKHHSRKRSKDELKKRQSRKHRKYSSVLPRNPPDRSYISNDARNRNYLKTHQRKTKFIEAPDNFSLVDNCSEALEFFSHSENALKRGFHVIINLESVKSLTPESIALLVACLNDDEFTSKGSVSGNSPGEEKCKLMLQESGFFNHVIHKMDLPKDDDKHFLLHKVSKQRVAPLEAKKACDLAMEKTLKSTGKFKEVYKILIECMANTHNHASFTGSITYDWWLFVYFDQDTNITSFTFLDLGCGIFRSLPVKNYKRAAIKSVLGMMNNADIMKKLLIGEIGSRTLREDRGRGIPAIVSNSEHPNIERLTFIANDIYADIQNNEIKKIKNQFSGTLIYFEIHP